MTLDKSTIKNLTQLSRIDCSEDEQEALLLDLGKILGYIKQLDEIDTSNVPPCNYVLDDVDVNEREDVIGSTLSRDDFLKNAPSQIGGMIRVPPVLKQQ